MVQIIDMIRNRISYYNLFNFYDSMDQTKLDIHMLKVKQEAIVGQMKEDLQLMRAYIREKQIVDMKHKFN